MSVRRATESHCTIARPTAPLTTTTLPPDESTSGHRVTLLHPALTWAWAFGAGLWVLMPFAVIEVFVLPVTFAAAGVPPRGAHFDPSLAVVSLREW